MLGPELLMPYEREGYANLDLWTGSWTVASWLKALETAPGEETDLMILSIAEYLCQKASSGS